MHLATILILASCCLASSNPSFDHAHALEELERRGQELQVRQKVGDLAFCFGDGSICANSNALRRECDKVDATNTKKEYYVCLCANGFVPTRQACGWCNDAWGISQVSGIDEIYTSRCTSAAATIAPIPATIIDRQSSYNATWTGTLLGHSKATDTASDRTTTRSTTTTTTTSRSRATLSTDSESDSTSRSTSQTARLTGTLKVTQLGGGAQNFPQPTIEPGVGGLTNPGNTPAGSGALRNISAGFAVLIGIATFCIGGIVFL